MPNPKKPSRAITILVADPQPIIRKALRVLLDSLPGLKVVAEANDGEEALACVQRHKPRVALLDVAMPKLNGIEVTKRIRDAFPATRVLALTAIEGESFVRAALAAGAGGYVPKSALPGDLIDAIRVVSAGDQYVHPRVADALLTLLSSHVKQPMTALSLREAEVFRFVALGYTNKEIAVRLSLSVKSVDTYKVRAAEKLGVKSRAEIVRLALEKGWLADDGFSGRRSELAAVS